MAQQTGNPTILSPTSRFAIPHYRSYSRSPSLSPSRSPYRRQHFTSRELDPLLSNLSPTSTLEALTATQAISLNGEERQTALTTSIANASESERTFGIRAALAGKKLREWYQEVRGWSWPTGGRSKFNGFEMPSAEQRARNRSEYDHDGNIDPAIWGYAGSAALAGAEDEQYYGSIPVLVVTHYEKRIEEIADDMATLEVEELMEHVREAHLSRSRPTSSDGSPLSHPSPDDYNHLDDFTAVITTTILQALPYISRLDALLDVWSIRLSVLRQVPKFLRWLEEAQIAMGSAWHAIGSSPGGAPVKTKSDISRRAFSTMKSILEEKILELGHGIDKMLDALEGRGDTVPDQWIDRMEGIEANFGSWVMEAEKQVMENELRFLKEREESHQRDMVPDRQKPGKQSSLSPDLNLTESHDLETYPLAMSSWLVEPASPNNARNEAGATPSAKKMVSTSALSNRRIPSQAVSEVPEGNDVQHPTLHSLMLTPNLVQPSPPSTPVYAETDMRSLLYAHVNALSQTADEDRGPGPGYHTHSGPHDAKLQSELGLPENTYITTPAAVDAPLMADLQRPFDRQLQPLQSHHSRNQSGVSTDTSYPGSATSEYFSDMSSPEIQDAVMVEYFSKATEVSTQSPVQSPPGSVSRASSRTERGSISTIRNVEGRTRDQTSSYSGSRASSVALEPMVPEFIGSSLEAAFGHGVNEVSPPRKTKSHDLQPKELPDVLGTSQALDYFTFKDSLEQSPSVRALSKRQSVAAANSALLTTISNPRSGFDDYSELGAENPSITSQQHQKSTEAWLDLDASPGESTETFSPSRSTEDQLEARISSILTDIPMRIKLASEPKSETLEDLPPRTSSIPKGLGIISPTLRSDKAQTGSPAVTIAPAFPRSARSRHSLPGDPEIKLYHLHQPGKEAPIKLFVRLVGDARERVMVRVGGGWADLGERPFPNPRSPVATDFAHPSGIRERVDDAREREGHTGKREKHTRERKDHTRKWNDNPGEWKKDTTQRI
ncbi:MAG: hypothetical protein FRX48_08998 [Lasallia pustulata]|uniref:GAR domain-containing protein n=1 Tax=Lasallia pustulata TaxID=136370 RepID=A0A5M8PDY1_9LECA|nr:MAG: hypothetical protein FRX48_08998 [Lasallia pustulata]